MTRPTAPTLAVGDQAPDFELMSTSGKQVRLSALRGVPVVLYFYPEDHTPGCTLEAKGFRNYFDGISLHKAAVVGVSHDNYENHCSFRDKHALPFELLSDEDGAVHDLYGAWQRTVLGNVKVRRCTFLLAPDGTVAKVYPKVNPLGHPRQVVSDLEELVRRWAKRPAPTSPPA